MSIPDEFLIKEKIDIWGGGCIEIHDSRLLSTFIESEIKRRNEIKDFHNKLMEMDIKAYRCNDGWVDRKNHYVTFFSDDVKKGYYWGNKDLKVGDIIFIGNMDDGGRFAKIIKCDKLWVSYDGKWTRKYGYEPLDETLNGNDRPYITEKTMTIKQKLLRFFGFFNEFQIQTEI